MKNHPKNRAMRAIDTEPDRLANTLKAFVRNGQAAQREAEMTIAEFEAGQAWWNALTTDERAAALERAAKQLGRLNVSAADAWRVHGA